MVLANPTRKAGSALGAWSCSPLVSLTIPLPVYTLFSSDLCAVAQPLCIPFKFACSEDFQSHRLFTPYSLLLYAQWLCAFPLSFSSALCAVAKPLCIPFKYACSEECYDAQHNSSLPAVHLSCL